MTSPYPRTHRQNLLEWFERGYRGINPGTPREPVCGPARRTLEESVEACLATGVSPARILTAVTDVLHNEARRQGCYPSELRRDESDAAPANALAELVDVQLQLWIAMRHFTPREVNEALAVKIELLKSTPVTFNLDGSFYRRKSE